MVIETNRLVIHTASQDEMTCLIDKQTDEILNGLRIRFVKEHSFTPAALVKELTPIEQLFFNLLFTGKLYKKYIACTSLRREFIFGGILDAC